MTPLSASRPLMGRYAHGISRSVARSTFAHRSFPASTRLYSSANAAADADQPSSPTVLSRVANAVKSTFSSGSYSTPAADFGKASTWNEALKEAESLVVEKKGGPVINTQQLIGDDLRDLKNNIMNLLGSGHPMLDTVSKYYFQADGKHIRPMIILLIGLATSKAPKKVHVQVKDSYEEIDTPISELGNFHIPTLNATSDASTSTAPTPVNSIYLPKFRKEDQTYILPSQRRLGEIVEMIHTSSLLHDDVIDAADTRRNLVSANENFGNKMAILGGDFLLARASIALARLRNQEVTELMSTVIANLVEGEFMQLRNGQVENGRSKTMTTFEYYMEKSYMKTASLISKSCRASAVLGGATNEVCDIAYTYGKNLGLAFQLVDDMLDFTVSSEEFGKPAGADLKLGLATAPVLFAWEEFPELGKLIKRNFNQEGDVETAWKLVLKSQGLEQTRRLAQIHCQRAIAAVNQLPDSQAKTALIQLTEKVLDRKNSVSYAGGQESPLADYCQDDTVDVFALAFIYQIQNGLPVLNLASHCQTTFPGSPLLNCPQIGKDISTCQARGKTIVVSIGGASGSYSIPDAAAGTAFADKVWDMFLGGSSSTRPFGEAILDGVDLDLESGQNSGYVAFVDTLRAKFSSAGSGRKYYITAAPQCPYPDQATKDALQSSWFDLVWVQFYNNYCGVHSFGTDQFNFDTWNTWATTVSLNKNVRILLGVPGGPGAAGTGVIDAVQLNTILGAVRSSSNFGGVMMWDAGVARKSGLAASASSFLKAHGSMEAPAPPLPPKVPTITAPSVAVPTITAPSIAPPAVPTVVKAPEEKAATTTLVVPADKKTVPTMTLGIPYGVPLKLAVHVHQDGNGGAANPERASVPALPMETDWMGRPYKIPAVRTVKAAVPAPTGGFEDFDVVIEAKCHW
ncbi:coq1 putative hexaprenyl diphosphate synthase [Mortierella antarctica]|nr:coq1 putative hexaprenyl diphosphate synthase [Mortierella antarctica]